MLDGQKDYYPIRDTFSRQQVRDRTGVSDDVLAFWIKQGILQPLPAAPRAHRRFQFEQLHVAAVMNSMRALGANIGVLRVFSDALQEGLKLIRESEFDSDALGAAARLVNSLDRFSKGTEIKIYDAARDPENDELAKSEADVIRGWINSDSQDGASIELAEFVRSLSPQQGRAISWARILIDHAHLTHTGAYGSRWIAWLDENGAAQFEDTNAWVLESGEGPDAAFYIPVSKLIARIWSDRLASAKSLYEERRQKFLEEYRVRRGGETMDP